jgi:hypothetical protein
MCINPVAVDQPKHPVYALATFELTGYRRQLEHAIAFHEKNHSAAPALPGLRAALAEVAAEQDDRARIAAGNA